jgi:hypothetical protein
MTTRSHSTDSARACDRGAGADYHRRICGLGINTKLKTKRGLAGAGIEGTAPAAPAPFMQRQAAAAHQVTDALR